MDYGIIISGYESVYQFFLSMTIGVCFLLAVVGGCRWCPKISKRRLQQTAGLILLVYFLIATYGLTIYGREKSELPQLELRLFWCIREAWIQRNSVDWYNVIANTYLFVPLGAGLSLLFTKMRSFRNTALAGLGVSTMIECSQLVMRIGLCELDDLLNNTMGAVLGLSVVLIVSKQTPFYRRVIAILLVLLYIGGIAFALWSGQPVFEYIEWMITVHSG